MRASQHRIALAGAGMFFLLINTLGCLQQTMPPNSSQNPFVLSTPAADRVAPGVRLGDRSLAGIAKSDLPQQLRMLASELNQKPQNAHKQPESLEIVTERTGRELDIGQTQQKIVNAKQGERVEPVFHTVKPAFTTADLRMAAPANGKQAGHFSTPILDRKPDRIENIRVTAGLLNNTVIEPGEEFSFNKIIGLPNEAKGFKLGTVFADGGTVKEELGGGMCQISSTLYNVALDQGLQITERHPHSKPVPYVAAGRDATIYDDKDLRFRNTTPYPILIKSWVSNQTAHVAFYQPITKSPS